MRHAPAACAGLLLLARRLIPADVMEAGRQRAEVRRGSSAEVTK